MEALANAAKAICQQAWLLLQRQRLSARAGTECSGGVGKTAVMPQAGRGLTADVLLGPCMKVLCYRDPPAWSALMTMRADHVDSEQNTSECLV